MTLISLAAAKHYLHQLDLNYIAELMCATHYPLPRWTQADALHCLQLYKNFLFLQKKHLPLPLVPTREIDEFWHNHILYTRNYFHDCEQIFGHYLHHQPASPMEDKEKLAQDFLRTKALYCEEFKEPLTVMLR
ncbi:MAG: hypothetical protein JO149_02680 [Gammaproteobacteria bacterium]|nr:hypothetical protein [Gammaproteobacteria bacterium]